MQNPFRKLLTKNSPPKVLIQTAACLDLSNVPLDVKANARHGMISQTIFRGSLRSLALPCAQPGHLLLQQPQPLISLRHFSAQHRLTSVLVRSKNSAFAETSTSSPATFEQLGLGEELLSFLSEHHLQTPTEIQVGRLWLSVCQNHHMLFI